MFIMLIINYFIIMLILFLKKNQMNLFILFFLILFILFIIIFKIIIFKSFNYLNNALFLII